MPHRFTTDYHDTVRFINRYSEHKDLCESRINSLKRRYVKKIADNYLKSKIGELFSHLLNQQKIITK